MVASNHYFHETPAQETLLEILTKMDQMGADILKIAVMPQSRKDVLTLLSATEEMDLRTAKPLITMSMGPVGMISRLCGEVFGSALTFGTVGKASAPGQIDAKDLASVLQLIHKSMETHSFPVITVSAAAGCGLCALYRLREAGITHLKLVGRGNYADYMERDICNLKRALTLLEESGSEADYREKMKRELFPKGCSGNCYYRE